MLAVLAMLAMASCNNQDKQAEALYREAETLFEQKDYNAAKIMIDSIKTACPKAFDTRKKAIGLMQRVELAEQQRSVAYLDSLAGVWQQAFDEIKGRYLYRKNPEYQDKGTFIVPSQDLARNNNRTMLVASTDEDGVMHLTSVLVGRPIDHHVLKVTLRADGTFAETRRSDLYYTSTHLGVVTEKAEFEVGRTDGGLVDFIIANQGKPLTIQRARQPAHHRTAEDRGGKQNQLHQSPHERIVRRGQGTGRTMTASTSGHRRHDKRC